MTTSHQILVPLAQGFEETEAVTIIDVLRRAGLDVTVAGLQSGPVRGSHAITIIPDASLGELDLERFTMIVLPGGMPGTRNLMRDEGVLELVRRLHREGRPTAAICAAPLVLQEAGILAGVSVTSHPSVRGELTKAVVRDAPRVVKSGLVTTSQGVGTALEFALALVSDLVSPEKSAELARAMVTTAPS